MRWLSIVASLALACAISPEWASPVAAGQASSAAPSASSSTTSKSTTHKKKHHYVKRQPTQKAPTPDRIIEIQSALSRGGYYQGQPSGKWDSNTVAAVQKFQSAKGIEANGKLDAPTLQKLGLGSDIAGVSAPKHVPPPSCCSTAPATLMSPPSSQNTSPGNDSTTTVANAPTHQN
jgi:peptidoglycan hydrolase-like protein with peptidoglycan-binding domain